MSLTPGCYILSDGDNSVGVTLPEMAAIVAEWDQGADLSRETQGRLHPVVIKGVEPELRVRWEPYTKRATLCVRRGHGGESTYVEEALITEMRKALEAAC